MISKSRLRRFWADSRFRDSEGPLKAWYAHVSRRSVVWRNWSNVTKAFATASIVGNCVVFNIGGNKYRLATRILYSSQKVFILKVMTHDEYDQDAWKADCGCFQEPPRRPASGDPKARRT